MLRARRMATHSLVTTGLIEMRFISVCSGIEAASVAWEPLGFKAVAFSEIDPFCCSLLSQRFPAVPNYGDMTRYEEWPNETPVDIAIGGTPCQSFSIAGLRGGLQDDRGNLALVYCRILQKYRPRWFVWENVPGCLSSFSDEEACSQEAIGASSKESEELWQSSDFVSMLSAFRECGYCVAGRILDAQYFGVPQRRRRVFVVGYLGDWRYPAEVLFEPESVQWDTSKSGKKKSKSSRRVPRGTGDRCENVTASSTGSVSHCLNAGGMGRQDYETETMIVAAYRTAGDGYVYDEGDKCAPLTTATDLCTNVLAGTIGVRRLTPVECERLQGFPDNWTLIRDKCGVDGPRYKAVGNSMAVPVVRWIGQRILRIDQQARSAERIG